MNAISRWPASRLAQSRTVSEIRRRKMESDLEREDEQQRSAPLMPPGIRLFR